MPAVTIGTIQGGTLNIINSGTLVNGAGGRLLANAAGQTLLINGSGTLTNNGTMQVNAGSTMHVQAGPFTNFGASTLTSGTYIVNGTLASAGTLQIDELGNTGGEIVSNAAKIILSGPSSSFVDAAGKVALLNLSTNAATGSFSLQGGRNFTTAGNFANNGTLTVGSGSKFGTGGSLTNFNSTTGTLTGGTYNVTGTLEFANANVATNAATITLRGTSSQIINQSSAYGLANFATNASAGSFTLAGNRNFNSAGAFTNAGTIQISKGNTFTVHGGGNYTQTGGKTIVDGTLTTTASVSFLSGNLLLSAPGIINIQGGTLFGIGNLAANVQSSGTITPADSASKTAILTVTGTYTQNSTGALDISIAGTTPGTNFDQINIAGTAKLNGTLNISRPSSFVPTIGSTFVILSASARTGTFATLTGTSINSSEHFAVVYHPRNVTLQVVLGAA